MKTPKAKSLTKAQRRLLELARKRSYPDGSGYGVEITDGREMRTAERLKNAGLAIITMPVGSMPYGALKITDDGRAALSAAQGTK